MHGTLACGGGGGPCGTLVFDYAWDGNSQLPHWKANADPLNHGGGIRITKKRIGTKIRLRVGAGI